MVIFALIEAIALSGSVAGVIFLWGYPFVAGWRDVVTILTQSTTLAFCCIVGFYYNDLYDTRIVRSLGGFVPRLVQSLGVAMLLLAGLYMLFPRVRIAEGPLLSSILLMVGLLLLLRAVGYGFLHHPAFAGRVLIMGSGPLAQKLVETIEAHPHAGYRIVGLVDDARAPEGPPLRYPVYGPLGSLVKIAEEAGVNRVIVAMSERRGRLPMDQLLEAQARGILVEDGLRTYEQLTQKLAIETLTPSVLIFSGGFIETRFHAGVRRLSSLAVAAVGLVISAPLMALIALAITLDSRGPVLFVQERVGQRGRPFKLLKFRTMIPCEESASEWVQDNEDRVTRVGRFLRKFRLDELPQFINILRGDMNLVGPRPHPASNAALFAERIPYYVLRTGIRPGVTGWAQIRHGYANNLEEEIEKMRYDLYYIQHVSFWFDVRILVDTVKIVLFGRGSHTADAYPSPGLADAAPAPPTPLARRALESSSRARR